MINIENIGDTSLKKSALEILTAGIESVLPNVILPKYVNYDEGKLSINGETFDIGKGKVYVIGCGKASGLMAQVFENIIPPEKITAGIVNSIEKLETKKIIIQESSHPIPDQRGIIGVKKMLEMTKNLTEKDTVICLISGGGSSLLSDPPKGIYLDDIQKMTKILLNSGAETYEINIIRKHVSTLKGGNLAKILQPAKVISLIISDDLDGKEDIASRPTMYEDSTFQDAYNILKKYNLINKIPSIIHKYILKGLEGKVSENPKKGEPFFKNVHNYILADYETALNAMKNKSFSLGFNTCILPYVLKGETKLIAKKMGEFFKNKYNQEKQPLAILYGSETVVSITGNGKGGRIQEFLAYLIKEISNQRDSVIAGVGSDGIDFIPGVGGAIIDNNTYNIAKEKKLDMENFLKNNDSYTLHYNLGSLILMPSTNTHVGDLHVYLQQKNN